MLDNGTYRGRAVNASLGKSDNGNMQIAVLCDFTEVPNTQYTWYGFFTEKTYARTLEALEYFGWTGDDLAVFDPAYVEQHGLSGLDTNEVALVVEQEEYDGKTRAKIQWVNRLGGTLTVKNVVTGTEARSFADTMRGEILKRRQAAGAAAPADTPAGKFPWEEKGAAAPAKAAKKKGAPATEEAAA